jgi:hypothetical protein
MSLLSRMRELPRTTRFFLVLCTAIAVTACGARFIGLERAPPGFYVDEAAISAQVICVRDTGSDWWGSVHPLFSPVLGGGFATPTWIYPAAAWTGIFGDGIAAFRSLAALAGTLTVLGVGALVYRLTANVAASIFAALACAISPWAFLGSRVAWDPSLAPAFLAWGLALAAPGVTKVRLPQLVVAGLLFSLAAYAYPPARLTVAILLAVIGAFALVRSGPERVDMRRFLRSGAVLYGSFLVFCGPLLVLTLSGELQGRFDQLAIWNRDYLAARGDVSTGMALRAFLDNLTLFLHPDYWIFRGDANLRHHFGFGGMLSPLDVLAWLGFFVLFLGQGLRREPVLPVLLLFTGLIAAILPAALTSEGNPHALRSNTSVVFLAGLTGLFLAELQERWSGTAAAILAVAALSAVLYGWAFFTVYPARAANWFDQARVQIIEERLNRNPPDFAALDQLGYAQLAIAYHALRLKRIRCPR